MESLSCDIARALAQLDEELNEGDITRKGYEKRRTQLFASTGLTNYLAYQDYANGPDNGRGQDSTVRSDIDDETGSQTYSFDTEARPHSRGLESARGDSSKRASTDTRPGASVEDLSRAVFRPADEMRPPSVLAQTQAGDLELPYDSYNEGRTPEFELGGAKSGPAAEQMLPLEPRDIPFAINDPHNASVAMSQFDNIAGVLRHRGRTIAKRAAFMVLDAKGKEVMTITWDKLASRAEKVAQVIREKSGLYRGDRVALVYRDCEVVDYAIALFGCFIAGVVAVPINRQEDFAELTSILAATQAHLALTTDANLKTFHRELSLNKQSWPRGVEWWKTNEFGSFHPKKKDELPPLQAPELAYVEYSRSPTGDLRGVVVSHRTIMHQMACLSAVVSTAPDPQAASRGAPGQIPGSQAAARPAGGGILISYLDPRQAIGMIMEVLLSVYHGYTTVWCPPSAIPTPGLFAHLITRYRATIILADYPGLKTVAYNYQNDPMSTRGKRHLVDFSSIKLCLIDCLTIDVDFHEIVADRWLRPLGSPNARQVLTPMLCLPEHGGMVISMRDQLGGHERIQHVGAQIEVFDNENDLDEIYLDREALKANEVNIVAIADPQKRGVDPNVVRVGSFWYPIADATVAVVDPETSQLCPAGIVGEIWIDSPSMSACYWLLPRHTDAIFHARPSVSLGGEAQQYEQEFLRTGLLGFVVRGRIFVLGLYEDRLRQKVEWTEDQLEVIEYRYHYVSHLVSSIVRGAPRIFDCSAFDVYVNSEHLPVIILETQAASTTPITPSGPSPEVDHEFLDCLAEKVIEVLLEQHNVRIYCVLVCAPNVAPRVSRNGRQEIGNMLCRKAFERGALPSVSVKFAVERAVLNLPVGADPVGGIWSKAAFEERHNALQMHERQLTAFDDRKISVDERTSTNLADFNSVVDVLQWRMSRQIEELALCTIDARGKEGKGITWRKLDLKIAGVAAMLRTKLQLRSGSRVVLMYSHSEEYFFAIHACLCLGITAVPMAPLDPTRLGEDVPAFLSLIKDMNVRTVLCNAETSAAFSSKLIAQHLKHAAAASKTSLPNFISTAKPVKQTRGCRELGFVVEPAWLRPDFPALVWLYWTPDQRPSAVTLSHRTIMGACKVQKETCQMPSSRPLLGSIRSTSGMGFLHSCLLGAFVGCTTYYLSPVDFASNSQLLVHILARYKIKDCYVTPQTVDHLLGTIQGKVPSLHEVKNLAVTFEGRPGTHYFGRLKHQFGPSGLEPGAINATYSHVVNPTIATRAYMSTEPIELYLDSRALREGYVQLTNPQEDPFGLIVQDSGMVPVSTQVAIVNPETCQLCRVGEFGEIWVTSEGNADGFYGSRDPLELERFDGRLQHDESMVRYARTGDLGFIYTVNRNAGAMQTLFVLGAVGETFEVNGLIHFPTDIEHTVERSHRLIMRGGVAVFQSGGQVVLFIEVHRTTHLSAAVPVIVNAVLDEHQIVVDKVAFVAAGLFPRSRLRERQRGRILASWIRQSVKSCTVFSIRGGDGIEIIGDGMD